MHKKLMKTVFIMMGFISLGLGIVGIVLPILPSTPFFLFTVFCFTRGSERFHDWFISTSLYKRHLQSFVNNKCLTLKSKLYILIPASLMLSIPFILVNNIYMRVFIIFLVFSKYFYFFKFIRTIPKSATEEAKH